MFFHSCDQITYFECTSIPFFFAKKLRVVRWLVQKVRFEDIFCASYLQKFDTTDLGRHQVQKEIAPAVGHEPLSCSKKWGLDFFADFTLSWIRLMKKNPEVQVLVGKWLEWDVAMWSWILGGITRMN